MCVCVYIETFMFRSKYFSNSNSNSNFEQTNKLFVSDNGVMQINKMFFSHSLCFSLSLTLSVFSVSEFLIFSFIFSVIHVEISFFFASILLIRGIVAGSTRILVMHFSFINPTELFMPVSKKNAYYLAWTIANKQINLLFFSFWNSIEVGSGMVAVNASIEPFNLPLYIVVVVVVVVIKYIKHFSLHSQVKCRVRIECKTNEVFVLQRNCAGFFSPANEWTNPEMNN